MPYDQMRDPYGYGGQMPPQQYPQQGMGGPGMPYQQMGKGGYGMSPYPQRNGVATASLVLGIVALVTFILLFVASLSHIGTNVVGIISLAIPIFGILALILGIVGISKAKSLMGAGKAKSIAGIILGTLATVSIAALIAFGLSILNASQGNGSPSTSSSVTETSRTSGNDGATSATNVSTPSDANVATSDGTGAATSTGPDTSTVPTQAPVAPPTTTPSAATAELAAMLSGPVWELHADDGTVAAKFTFNATDKTYAYWKGDADPLTQTGDRFTGHYDVYIDEDAYAYIDSINGQGSATRQQIEELATNRGEPVHYMLIFCYSETQVIGGVSSPTTSSGTNAIIWDCNWFPESKHIHFANVQSSNVYDGYDSTVPLDQRETAMTRLSDMATQGIG